MSGDGDPTTTTDTDTQAGDAGNSISHLRAECEKAWAQVKETQQQLDQSRCSTSATQSASQQPLVSILREKERHLRAEIAVTKDLDLQSLPSDPQVVEAALLEDLHKEVMQLKETLSLVDSQRQELQASIEQEQQYEQQLLAVHEKLQEKCNSLESQELPEDAVETVAQELETKINTARKTEQTIMKKMADFVGKHFPVPDPAQVEKTSKDLRSRKQQSNRETLPLKDILLELMTKCVESPNDPYLVLDERHWPAYIELLLRCNIVLQHPDDDRRIKLVPFHL